MQRVIAMLAASALSSAVYAVPNATDLIGGKPVTDGSYMEVVRIRTGNAGCTATIVGPRVLATASHCGSNGSTSEFKLGGQTYRGKFARSPLYPNRDHDIAVVVLDRDVEGVMPASIGGVATVGIGITILGYGCTQPGGSGGNDGILRMGESAITGFSNYDFVSRKKNGAALCYGDSGGPAFVFDENGTRLLLGINSKGNIRDTNYNTRTDLKESKEFLTNIATRNNVVICGINQECSRGGSESPNPPEDSPEVPTPPEAPAPDFSFDLKVTNGAEGERFKSAEVQNGVFILENYFLRCPYCNENAPNVDALADLYSNEPRVKVLDVGIDKRDSDYATWNSRHNPNHPVLMDAERKVATQFGVTGYPTVVVMDCMGRKRYSASGVWSSRVKREIQAKVTELLAERCTVE